LIPAQRQWKTVGFLGARQALKKKGLSMTSRTIEMQEVRIPLEAAQRLSDEDRYTYYMLGHMFNELMCLQKLVGYALCKHDDRRPARVRPEHAQALFLFRMASSKIWEAILSLRSKEIAGTLRSAILPRMADGAERLKTLNAAVNAARWLADMRNGIGFHFPSFAQWRPFTTPDGDWEDDVIFVGKQTGNTFYDGSDSIAQHWMFRQYGPDVRAAVDPLINEMIELLRLMNSFLEDTLGVFVAEVLLEGKGQHRIVGKVIAPLHDKVVIPFWTTSHNDK
jgi:hypothetical protein